MIKEAIILARKHVADDESTEPSARHCLEMAIRLDDLNLNPVDYKDHQEAILRWCRRSLSYSVGQFHKDYDRVNKMFENARMKRMKNACI